MRDPYRVLGVPPNIDQAALRRVFHRLAKKYHPDLHPGDARVEAHFKEIAAAYSLLSDPVRRDRYDRGDIKPSETWTASYTDRPLDRDFFRVDDDFVDAPEIEPDPEAAAEDWFSRFSRPRPPHAPTRMRGTDVTYIVPIAFGEAARGGRKLLRLSDGARIEFNIPPGTVHRDILKLDGKGRPGFGGAPDGDAFIEFHVAEHPRLRRDGYDVTVDVPLDPEAFRNGTRVMVPTLEGERWLNVPPGEPPFAEIRLEGGGIIDPFRHRRGDLVVRLVPSAATGAAAAKPHV
jgi:DnaJ-class molecular chaperone